MKFSKENRVQPFYGQIFCDTGQKDLPGQLHGVVGFGTPLQPLWALEMALNNITQILGYKPFGSNSTLT